LFVLPAAAAGAGVIYILQIHKSKLQAKQEPWLN
jgi:hypothetical protein